MNRGAVRRDADGRPWGGACTQRGGNKRCRYEAGATAHTCPDDGRWDCALSRLRQQFDELLAADGGAGGGDAGGAWHAVRRTLMQQRAAALGSAAAAVDAPAVARALLNQMLAQGAARATTTNEVPHVRVALVGDADSRLGVLYGLDAGEFLKDVALSLAGTDRRRVREAYARADARQLLALVWDAARPEERAALTAALRRWATDAGAAPKGDGAAAAVSALGAAYAERHGSLL